MAENQSIVIKGARVNNLKNISLEIPQGKLVVVTGVSGSGKSSLAFDLLYGEGQRRYVESLSSYARQFLGRMSKPDCDFIQGIPPAIAIEQKVVSRNPRSTVGTSTEIYDYLRLLYARIGHTFSPISGQEVKKHTEGDILEAVHRHPQGTRYSVLSPVILRSSRTLEQQLDALLKSGYTRLDVDGQAVSIQDYHSGSDQTPYILIDRLKVTDDKETESRLLEDIETALLEGDGSMSIRFHNQDGSTSLESFSTRFEADGMTFQEPSEHLFSFNSPLGACPTCEGFGSIIGIDERLVIPNQALSVYDGAVVCWRGDKMGQWKDALIQGAQEAGFPIFKPYFELSEKEKDMLWKGTPYFHGINDFFQMVKENQYKIQYRVMLARYRGKTVCPDCRGRRLTKEATWVRIQGKSITELVDMPIQDLQEFFLTLKLSDLEQKVSTRILAEINARLGFMVDVGLGYLTLNRLSNTLSGGESQRINLAKSLGSSLVGSLYILDEPSIGLHSRDTDRLIAVLKKLRDLGNTVVVVEHDEEIIRQADYIIDLGPMAGRLGGEIVYAGNYADIASFPKDGGSHTVNYLTGREQIAVPWTRRPWNNRLIIKGARENNLKNIDVTFPLNVMTVVTGVSGSGKSTLVSDILYRALKRDLEEATDRPGEHSALEGDLRMIRHVEFVDQNPIGRSSRSNPVTYLKAWDVIRDLWADQPLSKQMGYQPSYFSFNTESGGRCEECKGEGTITVEMQFMADLTFPCEACHGKRFKSDALEVRYHEHDIHDILEMTVNEAIEFFRAHGDKKIVKRLEPLSKVGLGYIKLGQPSSTLSGGENQRVKMAYFLAQEKSEPTLFIFDEPTTGLHFHDIKGLMECFSQLISRGHSVLIIEHNMDVIKCADYVIDLGPEGGKMGGELIIAGTPEEVAQCPRSHTGKFLREKLGL